MSMDNEENLRKIISSWRQSYDDLYIAREASKISPCKFTLFALLKNEIYFLPKFLEHYRELGVDRFVFLDDKSDDGSFEFLAQQPDTIIVKSQLSYGEMVETPSKLKNAVGQYRTKDLWRSLLFDKFAQNSWALMVDIDEFVRLPYGLTFPDLVLILEKQKYRLIWGVMLDTYPEDVSALIRQRNINFDLSQTWYFDGEKHLRLRKNRKPRIVHPGARARLYQTYGINKFFPMFGIPTKPKFREQMMKKLFPSRPLRYNDIWKPVLLKWQEGSYFRSSHNTSEIPSNNILLPILHFRFTGQIFQRIEMALSTNAYYNSSEDYRLLSELLNVMRKKNGSFTYNKSLPIEPYDNFILTKNTLGI